MQKPRFKTDQITRVSKLITEPDKILLGAIDATTPSSSLKPKPCVVVSTLRGLYLFRPVALGVSYKIKEFAFVLDIKSIKYVDDETRRFKCSGGKDIVFTSPDIEIIVTDMQRASAVFCYGSSLPHIINLVKYPGLVPMPPEVKGFSKMTLFRYNNICVAYNIKPDPKTIKAFELYENSNKTQFLITALAKPPEEAKAISLTLAHESTINTLIFNNYAPNSVCLIIKQIMKISRSIRSIHLYSYNDMFFEMGRFGRITNSVINQICLRNCFTDPARLTEFLSEFRNYRSFIQKLIIDGAELSIKTARELGKILSTFHCFKALEILILKNIKTDPKEKGSAYTAIHDAVEKLSFLSQLTFDYWKPTINISPEFAHFSNKYLTNISLSDMNFVDIFDPVFCPTIKYFSFAGSTFSLKSFKIFIDALNKHPNPFTLNLTKVDLTLQDLYNFLDEAHGTMSDNLMELNWSMCPVTPTMITKFTNYFLRAKNLKYLDLSYCFSEGTLKKSEKIIEQFFNEIADIKLWGIAIRADENTKLLPKITEKLAQMQSLASVDLYGQPLKTEDIARILSLPRICEINVDKSDIQSLEELYSLYRDKILKTETIFSVMPPMDDVRRLVGSNVTNDFIEFRKEISQKKFYPGDETVRSEYYNQYKGQMKAYKRFLATFPLSRRNSVKRDIYSMADFLPMMCYESSLHDTFVEKVKNSFSDSQCGHFNSVFKSPEEDPPEACRIPSWLKFSIKGFKIRKLKFTEATPAIPIPREYDEEEEESTVPLTSDAIKYQTTGFTNDDPTVSAAQKDSEPITSTILAPPDQDLQSGTIIEPIEIPNEVEIEEEEEEEDKEEEEIKEENKEAEEHKDETPPEQKESNRRGHKKSEKRRLTVNDIPSELQPSNLLGGVSQLQPDHESDGMVQSSIIEPLDPLNQQLLARQYQLQNQIPLAQGNQQIKTSTDILPLAPAQNRIPLEVSPSKQSMGIMSSQLTFSDISSNASLIELTITSSSSEENDIKDEDKLKKRAEEYMKKKEKEGKGIEEFVEPNEKPEEESDKESVVICKDGPMPKAAEQNIEDDKSFVSVSLPRKMEKPPIVFKEVDLSSSTMDSSDVESKNSEQKTPEKKKDDEEEVVPSVTVLGSPKYSSIQIKTPPRPKIPVDDSYSSSTDSSKDSIKSSSSSSSESEKDKEQEVEKNNNDVVVIGGLFTRPLPNLASDGTNDIVEETKLTKNETSPMAQKQFSDSESSSESSESAFSLINAGGGPGKDIVLKSPHGDLQVNPGASVCSEVRSPHFRLDSGKPQNKAVPSGFIRIDDAPESESSSSGSPFLINQDTPKSRKSFKNPVLIDANVILRQNAEVLPIPPETVDDSDSTTINTDEQNVSNSYNENSLSEDKIDQKKKSKKSPKHVSYSSSSSSSSSSDDEIKDKKQKKSRKSSGEGKLKTSKKSRKSKVVEEESSDSLFMDEPNVSPKLPLPPSSFSSQSDVIIVNKDPDVELVTVTSTIGTDDEVYQLVPVDSDEYETIQKSEPKPENWCSAPHLSEPKDEEESINESYFEEEESSSEEEDYSEEEETSKDDNSEEEELSRDINYEEEDYSEEEDSQYSFNEEEENSQDSFNEEETKKEEDSQYSFNEEEENSQDSSNEEETKKEENSQDSSNEEETKKEEDNSSDSSSSSSSSSSKYSEEEKSKPTQISPPPLQKPPLIAVPSEEKKSKKKAKKRKESNENMDPDASTLSDSFFGETKKNNIASILAPRKLPETVFAESTNKLFFADRPEKQAPVPVNRRPTNIRMHPKYEILQPKGLTVEIEKFENTEKKKSKKRKNHNV